MSTDFYVAVPIDSWPSAEQVQQCAAAQGYPIAIERFPELGQSEAVTDGAMVRLTDGSQAYLEGALFVASSEPEEVADINDRLAASSDFSIRENDAVMSVHVRSIAEMLAASYVISSLIVCFDGLGFEPQGDTGGKEDWAAMLLQGVKQLEGMGEP